MHDDKSNAKRRKEMYMKIKWDSMCVQCTLCNEVDFKINSLSEDILKTVNCATQYTQKIINGRQAMENSIFLLLWKGNICFND